MPAKLFPFWWLVPVAPTRGMMGGNSGITDPLADGRSYCPNGPTYGATSNALLMPFSAVLKNFYVELGGAPGAGTSWILTVTVNEVDSALVVTISDTDTTGSDTTHTVSVSPGDRIAIKASKTGSPAAQVALWGFEVEVA